MPTNLFSTFRQRNIDVGVVRRVWHSFRGGFQYWRSLTFSDLPTTPANLINNSATVVGAAQNALSIGGVSNALGISAGALGAVGATAALPVTAVVCGVLTAALAYKAVRSDRDGAHEILRPYVWSFIDDRPPQRNLDSDEDGRRAYEAALTLMQDGPSQYSQMGQKLLESGMRFHAFMREFREATRVLILYDSRLLDRATAIFGDRNRSLSDKRNLLKTMRDLREIWDNSVSRMASLWDDNATRPGGAVYDHIRRVEHAATYLQCPGIIQRYMAHSLGGRTATNAGDLLMRICPDLTTKFRDEFLDSSDRIHRSLEAARRIKDEFDRSLPNWKTATSM